MNESQRLLSRTPIYSSTSLDDDRTTDSTGEAYDNVPTSKRSLGLPSCIFLIFNRIIGTGIYATPSVILRASGSVGVAFLMWLIGALIAAAGSAVYVEFGTAMPRSGGEKNYLEFIYTRPRFLITCAFSVYAVIMGTAAANSVVFGEYVIHSLGLQPTRWNTRLVAWLCLTFCLFIHGVLLKWGIRLQNGLGMFKLVILSAIAIAGILCLFRFPGFAVREGYKVPRNFEWDKFWEGSGRGANAFVSGLYNVIWSFVGYSNANYALSEVKDPVRTIKRATPIALLGVTTMYFFINIAYFAVVAKDDILNSRRIVAALFFRNLFGPTTEKVAKGHLTTHRPTLTSPKALSMFIALSTLGNLLSGQFSQGRVIQELGREGIIPFSAFFASNKPFNAPLAGLFAQYTISCIVLFATPPGDAYLFMISTSSYCLAIVNTLVSFGLFLLYTSPYKSFNWNPPFRAPKLVISIFFLSNVFLVLVPFVPPGPDSKTYEHLPYWIHALVSWSVSLIGVGYWYVRCVWLPERNGYRLEREWVLQDDGVSRWVFGKVPVSSE